MLSLYYSIFWALPCSSFRLLLSYSRRLTISPSSPHNPVTGCKTSCRSMSRILNTTALLFMCSLPIWHPAHHPLLLLGPLVLHSMYADLCPPKGQYEPKFFFPSQCPVAPIYLEVHFLPRFLTSSVCLPPVLNS